MRAARALSALERSSDPGVGRGAACSCALPVTMSTPTRARGASTPRCRPSSSFTVRPTTTASGRCNRATSRTTGATFSRSICRGTGARVAPHSPASRRSPTGCPALLDAAGAPTAALVGHSLGSLAVLAAAARHPGRVTKIALVGPAVPMPVSDVLLDAARADDHVAYELINGWSYSPGKQLGGNQVPGLWLTGSGMRLLERNSPGRALHRSRGLQCVRRRTRRGGRRALSTRC